MQADKAQNAKKPITAQIDLSGQTLNRVDKNAAYPPATTRILWRYQGAVRTPVSKTWQIGMISLEN